MLCGHIFKSSLPEGTEYLYGNFANLHIFICFPNDVAYQVILGLVLLITKRNIPKITDYQYDMFCSFQYCIFIVHLVLLYLLFFKNYFKQGHLCFSVLVSTGQVTSLHFSVPKLGIKLFSLKFAFGGNLLQANLEYFTQVELLSVKPKAIAVIVLGSDHPCRDYQRE